MNLQFLKLVCLWAVLGSLQFLGAQTAHSVTLTWATNTTGAPPTSYNVLRGTATGAESTTPIGTVSATPALLGAAGCTATICTYVDTAGLVEGQEYFYEITATGANGTSGPSPEVTATIPFSTAPVAPQKPTVVVK